MDHSAFQRIVEEALMSLPEEFSLKLENIEVVIEDEPSEETLRQLRLPRGGLLGLYHGVPLKRKSVWSAPALPGKISIFKAPILNVSRTREEIRRRIREVVIHEIGHHFGLSDREMNIAAEKPSGDDEAAGQRTRRSIRRGRKK